MKNLENFDPTLECLKMCTLTGFFGANFIFFELKGDAVFEEKVSGGLINDIRSLINFHGSNRKSANFHFDGLVLSKACEVLDEKVQ